MDAVIARKRLEELRDSLDRSISVLGGSNSRHGLAAEYPPDPADAGAHLSETERADAMLDAARRQRSQVMVALEPDRAGHVRSVCRLRRAGSRGTAGGQAGRGPLRALPGQARPAPPLTHAVTLQRGHMGCSGTATRPIRLQ